MNSKELELVVALTEAKRKELADTNRRQANEMLLRMLSAVSSEVESISIGDDLYE